MWQCEQCGEDIEDQFDSCWRCADAPPAAPRRAAKCLACGSEAIVHGVSTRADREGAPRRELQLIYQKETEGRAFLPHIVRSALEACVCGDCGFTSFYATNHAAIQAARRDEDSH